MNKRLIQTQLEKISLSFFRKDFFGIFHGSISAKTENSRFLINTCDAIFDSIDEKTLIELYFQKDYRWNQASKDAMIHKNIYQKLSDAKFISITMPPYTLAYSLKHNIIIPKDYYGMKELGTIEIYNPKSFDDWIERSSSEITKYFLNHKKHLMIIRGYGVIAFNRDLYEMAKQLAILERSCRILMLENSKESYSLE